MMATGKKVTGAKSTKGKTPTLEALLEAVRYAVDVFQALTAIRVKFDNREREGLITLKKHAVRHAKAVKEGNRPDLTSLHRTIRLAENIAQGLDDRFDAIMRDSFTIFDREVDIVLKTVPNLRVRDGEKIKALQDALRAQLALPERTTHEETIAAYNAMMDYLPSVSTEAKQIVEAEREARRRERRYQIADNILDELEDLDI